MPRLRIAAAFVVLALLATACRGDGSSGSTATTVVRVHVSGEPEDLAIYDLIARGFEKATPGIDVRIVGVPRKSDHLAKLATSFAGGDPPEVFLVNYREYAQFAGRGAIAPIGPRLSSLGIDLKGYYPEATEAFTLNGTIQCLPQNVSSLVVYYNKVLFERAALSAPAADWTWQDLREYARRTTTGGIHGLGIEPTITRLAPFVWSNGGEVVDDLERPTRLELDQPAARDALAFVIGLVRDDHVVPSADEVAAQDLQSRFAAGKLAMLLSSRRETPALREVRSLSWDVAPLPVGRQRAGILHSDGYCLASKDGKTLSAAARFVAYAAGPPGQTIAALGGRIVPSLRSVAAGPFLDPTRPPEHDQVFLDAVATIRRTPVIPTWPEIEDVSEEILTRAFYEEGYTIDDALRDLDARTKPLFREAATDR